MADAPTTIPVVYPTHIVVDTTDGYLFRGGADGVLFTAQTARDFAAWRNADRKPGHQTYRVFALVPDAPEQVTYTLQQLRQGTGFPRGARFAMTERGEG